MNIVVCCHKKSFPRPGHEHLLEEDLGHVEGRDDKNQGRELQDYVQVLNTEHIKKRTFQL